MIYLSEQLNKFQNFISNEKVKKNINNNINIKNTNYILKYNKYKEEKNTYTIEETDINISTENNGICDITYEMFNLCSSTCIMIKLEKENIYIYGLDYINKNISIFLTNIDYLIIDYKNYDDNTKYVVFEDKFNINTPSFSKDLSFNTIKDSCDVDKIIYFVIINYIIAVILANIIII